MKTVRWGLVSTANINRRLMPAIRMSQHGQLTAVASRELSAAQQYANTWDIPHVFGSYQAMLDSGQVDAVYISLPNHLHAEWTIRALQAGVHVLCEKPFAPTLAEVDAMILTAQQTGRVLAEAFMYRHHPQTRLVGEWASRGKLGEVVLLQGVFNFQVNRRDDIRLVPAYGGGSLWDVGIYPLSMAQYIFGSAPLSVSAMQWIGDTGVDETFTGLLRYPGGGLAQIAASFRTPFYTKVEIIGTAGRLHLARPFTGLDTPEASVTFTPADDEEAPQTLSYAQESLYLGEVEDMHAAILEGRPNYLRLQETRDHVRTALALYEAARTGKEIILD